MSSDRKDARWQAAYNMLDAVSPNKPWESVSAGAQHDLLIAADRLLDDCPYAIPRLAAEWRRDPNE